MSKFQGYYSIEPGRVIARDGVPILILGIARDAYHANAIPPADADALAREIVTALNHRNDPGTA